MPLVVRQMEKATVKRGGPDGFCPLVKCEYCDQTIEPGSDGRVGWKRTETAAYREVTFVHDDCLEAHQEKRNTRLKTMPLDDFARHLAHNLSRGTTES